MSQTGISLITRKRDARLESAPSTLPPLLQRIFSARAIHDLSEVDYRLDRLLKPGQLSNLDNAARMLASYIMAGSSILVFGDYDADGATSTALCIRALAQMGAANIDFLLPDRLRDGYGVTPSAARKILERGPDLVITVDTGIASFDGLSLLTDKGIVVLVTDHHLPADRLPSGCSIVNPNAFQDSAGKCLAGVGVAFYLMLAVRSELRARDWFEARPEPNLADSLDLVALGTIADLVPLDYNNRVLVSEGLRRLRAGACSAGIQALIAVSGRRASRLTAQDIAFALAPRINAAGRLDDMTIGVQTLLAEDSEEAATMAQALDDINRFRRELQGEMSQQALVSLARLETLDEHRSHVLFESDWHEGIVGIIASRIKDETFRPSIAFARASDGLLKGSGRSIPGVHLRDMLDLVDKRDPNLIERFGGHAMAAGLSILEGNLRAFREAFESIVRQHADPACFDNRVECDGEIDAEDLTLENALMLEEAGPWGQKFPLPSFSGRFQVVAQRIVAERHLKFVLRPHGSAREVDAIRFYASESELANDFEDIHIHFEMSANEFRGEQSLQLVIRHIL